jgi:hypothetical protein
MKTIQKVYGWTTLATVLLLAGMVILAGACSLGLEAISAGPEESQPDTEVPVVVQNPGTGVMVSVPTISSRLLSELNATYEPSYVPAPSGGLSASAVLFATSVVVDLYQGGEEPIQTWSFDASSNLGQEPSEDQTGPVAIEAFLEIDAGSGYSMNVQVYNSNWRGGETAVVEGETDPETPFNIYPGQSTEVRILATPSDPIELTEDLPESVDVVQTPYEFSVDPENGGGPVFTDLGGEEWFWMDLTSYSPGTDDYVRIIVDPASTESSDAVMLIYDSAGAYMLQDEPAWSWGFMPDEYGGQGGTRAGLMGPALDYELETPFQGYMGLVIMNRDAGSLTETVSVTMELLNRPQPEVNYPNVFPLGEEPDEAGFLEISPGEEVTQTIFNEEQWMVHWFMLDGIQWGNPALMDTLPITVTATFDVLDSAQIIGGRSEWFDTGEGGVEIFVPSLCLMVGDTLSEDPPATYGPVDDPFYNVTENLDGSSTVEFTIEVDTTVTTETTMAALAVSNRWMGVEFTLSWTAPGLGELIIE